MRVHLLATLTLAKVLSFEKILFLTFECLLRPNRLQYECTNACLRGERVKKRRLRHSHFMTWPILTESVQAVEIRPDDFFSSTLNAPRDIGIGRLVLQLSQARKLRVNEPLSVRACFDPIGDKREV